MRLLRKARVSWPLIGIATLACALSVGLSMLLIQVQEVSQKNKDLQETAQALTDQIESMGQRPVVDLEDIEQGLVHPADRSHLVAR